MDDTRARLGRLTPRERQVFDLVVRGNMNKQIAHTLGTTERTIKAHRHGVMEKMQVPSLAELVSLVERIGALSIGVLILLGAVGVWFSFYLQLRNAIPVSIDAALLCLFATSNDCLAPLQLTGAKTARWHSGPARSSSGWADASGALVLSSAIA
ncbi:response regulator transcription factor [Bradyrhizobium canariense]|uniref:response regulator transcription factor n=1 Tax=Bradyrhizobium canariense TaxID=255045 RepID=UPI003F7CA1BC